nr:hypothetical protein [Rhodococcus wratislaviensis]
MNTSDFLANRSMRPTSPCVTLSACSPINRGINPALNERSSITARTSA